MSDVPNELQEGLVKVLAHCRSELAGVGADGFFINRRDHFFEDGTTGYALAYQRGFGYGNKTMWLKEAELRHFLQGVLFGLLISEEEQMPC